MKLTAVITTEATAAIHRLVQAARSQRGSVSASMYQRQDRLSGGNWK